MTTYQRWYLHESRNDHPNDALIDSSVTEGETLLKESRVHLFI